MNRHRTVMLVLLTVTAVLLLAPPAMAGVSLNTYEKQILTQVNKQRTKRHLPKLRVSAELVTAARAHSMDMGSRKFFSHTSPEGEQWPMRIDRYGYTRNGCKLWKTGENIYWGAGLFSSPCIVVDAWMKSPAHRRVILTKSFRDIGIGAVKTKSGYASVNGVVWFFTLDLGRRVSL